MKLQEAKEILKIYSRWRRGEDIEPMLKPSDIGKAIDIVIKCLDDSIIVKEANKWIDCNERLPDEDGNYLVFDCEIYIAYFSLIPKDECGRTPEENAKAKSSWCLKDNTQYSHWLEKYTGHGNNHTLLNPSHWQPLPSTKSINEK